MSIEHQYETMCRTFNWWRHFRSLKFPAAKLVFAITYKRVWIYQNCQ
jgi:hypothetical protein